VREAQQDGPQRVTAHGKDAVVILSAEDYARLAPAAAQPSLHALLRQGGAAVGGETVDIEHWLSPILLAPHPIWAQTRCQAGTQQGLPAPRFDPDHARRRCDDGGAGGWKCLADCPVRAVLWLLFTKQQEGFHEDHGAEQI
jgi:prevent-host-death family protein